MAEEPKEEETKEAPAKDPPKEERQLDRRSLLAGAVAGIAIAAPAAFLAGKPIEAELPPGFPSGGAPPPRPLPVPSASVRPASSAPQGIRMPLHAKPSFAQQGEDLVMKNILDIANIPKPTYIDIGAHDPVKNNNSYLFYTQGARGVLVEPNPTYAEVLRQKRPGDKVLEVGIGVDASAEADYYVIEGDGQLNTFSKAQADLLEKRDKKKIVGVIKRQLLKLNAVLDEHFKDGGPDLLSIDVEGLDYAILKTLDFTKHRPKVICVETADPETALVSKPILQLLESKGYQNRGGSLVNTIFLDEKTFTAMAARLKGEEGK